MKRLRRWRQRITDRIQTFDADDLQLVAGLAIAFAAAWWLSLAVFLILGMIFGLFIAITAVIPKPPKE